MAKERKKLNRENDVPEQPGVGNKPFLRKRKKGGCLKAFIITLCVSFGLVAVVVVGGLFIGDAVMKNNFGVSLFDVFAVMGDIGSYDEAKIVTNGYDEKEDAKKFYDSANTMLYFKTGEDAVLNSEYIKELLNDAGGDGGIDNLTASLLGMLKSDNFDKNKLGAYDGWKDDVNHADRLVSVTDREFAAFFDDLIIESGIIDDMLGDEAGVFLGGAKIDDLVSLDQIIIGKAAVGESSLYFAGEPARSGDVYMSLTFSLDINKTLDSVLPALDEQNGTPLNAFKWLFDWMLPDKTFLTLTADLNDASAGMEIELNSLSQETCTVTAKDEILDKYKDAEGKVTKMERLLIIMESLSGKDLRQSVNDSASGFMPYLCKSETESDFCFADVIALDTVTGTAHGNSFKIDLFGLLTDVLNSKTGAEATTEDIIVLMQALLCTDSGNAYSDDIAHRSDLYYDPADKDLAAALKKVNPDFDSIEDIKTQEDYDKLVAEYGKIQYKVNGAEIGEGYKNAYQQEFMNSLEKAYCLDLSGYTFEDITELFGINAGESGSGSGSQTELTDLLDGAKFAEAAKPESEIMPMQITDRMLGAIIRELMPQFIDETYGGYELELRTVRISQANGHSYVTVKFTLKISAMLDDSMREYLGGVLPEYITLGVTVDMSPGLNAEERDGAFIECFNEISSAADESILNGLTSGDLIAALKRMVPSLDLDGLLSTVSDGMQSVVDNMTNALPSFRFATSLADNSAYAAELPSLFDLAADLLGFTEGAPEDRVTGEELRSAMNYLANYEYTGEDESATADYVGFLKSLQQNYYIGGQLSSFDGIFTHLTGTYDASVFRYSGPQEYSYARKDGSVLTETYKGYLEDRTDTTRDKSVKMAEGDMLAILSEKIDDEAFANVNKFAKLIDVGISSDGKITLYIRLDITSVLDEKYVKMMGCDYFYGTVTVDTSDVRTSGSESFYGTTVELNGEGVTGSDYATLMKILNRFGGGKSFDLGALSDDIGKAAFETLTKLELARIDYRFADGEIVFPSFEEYVEKLGGLITV